MLKLIHLSVTDNEHGEPQLLNDVNLNLDAGQALLIQDRYSQGASTLLKVIAGYAKASLGQIILNDQAITSWPVYKRANAGIAYLPETKELFHNLSTEQNLLLACGPHPTRPKQHTLQQAYETFPLLARRSKVMAGALSGGEQQLLALVKTLMRPVKVLLLNEPAEGLAPQLIEQVALYLKHVLNNGTALLLIDAKQKMSQNLSAKQFKLL